MTRRALLSVFDKTGIVDFARELADMGWDIVSSGGTARELVAAGVPVRDVAEITGLPAILGHRVVTLHPKIHGGLLADLNDASHVADLERYGIEPFDLVVVVVMAVLICFLATIYPSRQAAKLKPVEALRYG